MAVYCGFLVARIGVASDGIMVKLVCGSSWGKWPMRPPSGNNGWRQIGPTFKPLLHKMCCEVCVWLDVDWTGLKLEYELQHVVLLWVNTPILVLEMHVWQAQSSFYTMGWVDNSHHMVIHCSIIVGEVVHGSRAICATHMFHLHTCMTTIWYVLAMCNFHTLFYDVVSIQVLWLHPSICVWCLRSINLA